MATSNIQYRGIEDNILFLEEENSLQNEDILEEINNNNWTLDFYNHYYREWDNIKLVCVLEPCYYEGNNVVIYYSYNYSDTWQSLPDEVEISKTNKKKLDKLITKMEAEIIERLPITKLGVVSVLSNGETIYKTI